MDISLTKWGNSLGIRLPAFVAKKLSLHNGDKVKIEVIGNKVIIEPIITNNRKLIENGLMNFKPEQITIIECVELSTEDWT